MRSFDPSGLRYTNVLKSLKTPDFLWSSNDLREVLKLWANLLCHRIQSWFERY